MDDLARRIAKLSPQQRAQLELQLIKKKGLPEPIAIVGMGCRFPGAESCAAFWQLLQQGRDAIAPIPSSRWSAEAFYDADPTTPGKTYCREGGFLDHIDQFDPEFFGIAPREASFIDPQQRVFLEVVWAALEDGGISTKVLSGSKTGVFVGISTNDYGQWLLAGPEAVGTYTTTGLASTMVANRLSYLLNLRGPSLAIDTACSSSLVAVHLACQSLRSGESDLAIAGGVNLILRPELTIGFSKLTALSPDNRCKAFDAAANGFVRSEGAGAVVLKPLSQAIAQGDAVYAVIRGSAVNQDGRTNGLTAPNPAAQAQVIAAALTQAGLMSDQVDYIEAHGTGTLLGDPIEAKALGQVLQGRSAPVRIGSVKSNIGHTEAAAGIASLIKTALCIKHCTLVPSLHFQTPNPHIPFASLPLQVQQTCEPWSIERPIAGVSAFAFGGTNAHMVLQGAPALQGSSPSMDRPRHILALSAKTADTLQVQCQQIQAWLSQSVDLELADVCHSWNRRRGDFPYRRAIAATTMGDLQAGLQSAPTQPSTERPTHRPQVVFLFTGQGSQYPGMGQELYKTQPIFRQTLDRCAELLAPYLDAPLLEVMFADTSDRLQQTAYTQPALFALEYALATLWQDWGIQPAAVLGHSIGEYVAACVAGILNLEDGLRLIAQRGKLMQSLPPGGVMVAIWANEATVKQTLQKCGNDQVAISTVNGPQNTVIAGLEESITSLLDQFHSQGIRTQYLDVSHAFHSPQMEPILPLFEHVAKQIAHQPTRIPLALNVTGTLLPVGETLNAQYWCRHAQEPVRFADSLQALHEQGFTCFLELGPHPILCSLGRRVLTAGNLAWLPTLKREQSDWLGLLNSLGQLYEQGFTVDWAAYDRPYNRNVIHGLPTYPFQRQRYWFEPPAKLMPVPLVQASSPSTPQDFYHLTWEPLPPLPPLPPTLSGRWLIFLDDQGVGESLIQTLQKRGAVVVTVRPGKTFEKKGAGEFQLNPRLPSDSRKLFEQLQVWADWQAVIYLWGLDGGVGLDSVETGTAGLLHCLQGMAAASLSTRLWVVAAGQDQPQDAAPTSTPVAGALWGLGSVIALEHPDLWGGWMLLDEAIATVPLAEQLLAQMSSSEREDRLAIQADRRWGARLTPWTLPTTNLTQPITIQPDKTYLITGGLGALGRATAEWLVDEGAKTLVLLSRRSEPEGNQDPLADLRQQGATVRVVAVDVADGEAVQKLVQTIQADHPPLAGVIHAAGALADSLLVSQSWQQFQTVMAPKVQGAWHLHRATAEIPLDFFVLFSSVASLLGSPGQSNYAAANGFLDGLAQLRRSLGLPAQSINWGPWQGSGLASQHRDTVQRLQTQGIESFTVTAGIQRLKTLITQGQTYPPQIAAVQVQWDQLLYRLPQAQPPPWLQSLAPVKQAVPARPRWQTLIHLSAAERCYQVQAYLHQEIVNILGRTDAIPADSNLLDVGLDSLMVMDLLGLCKRDLGLTLYPREVFEHPTLAALSDYLAQELVRAHQILDPSAVSEKTENWQIPIWGQVRDFPRPVKKLPGPIFLLSSPRSGSTLLRVMLAGHPDLFCPPELHLLPFVTFVERQTALAENYLGEGLQRAVMDLLGLDAEASDRHLNQWLNQGFDIPAIYDQLQRLSDRRLVDKSPTYGFSRSTLERAEVLFDQAHYIHLVRHPHAVIDSFVSNRMDKLFQVPDQDPYRLAEQVWQLSNQNIRDFLAGVEGDRSHTIRYEDLVQNPQAAMEALCTFLGLPFHQALVDPYSHAEQRMTDGVTAQSLPIDDPNFHRRRAIDPSLADAWKTIQLPQPLTTESQILAQTWHYILPQSPHLPSSSANRWVTTTPLTTMVEQTLTVRGLDLCVCFWGESDCPSVLCLHGVLEQGAIWDALAPTLVAQGYRVIAPDLRGHGKSAHLGPEGNYQLLDHLADIDALVQVLGLETVAVVGHSMGAMVAATWASARPEKVTSLTLVEPVVPGADDESQTTEQLIAHLDYLATAPTHTVYGQPTEARDRLHKALPFLSEARAEALTQRIIQPVPGGVQWTWDARLQVRTRFGLSGGTFTRDRYGKILSQVTAPTTLVFGESSTFVRPEDQTFQRDRLSNSTIHHIPGGHQLPLESPQVLVEILLDVV